MFTPFHVSDFSGHQMTFTLNITFTDSHHVIWLSKPLPIEVAKEEHVRAFSHNWQRKMSESILILGWTIKSVLYLKDWLR